MEVEFVKVDIQQQPVEQQDTQQVDIQQEQQDIQHLLVIQQVDIYQLVLQLLDILLHLVLT